MRKAWYTLLIFLMVALIGFSAAHILVDGSKEAVIWEEETVFGDKSAVEGVRVKAINHVSHHLMWETEGTLGSALNPETKFTFSNDSIYLGSETEYTGLDIAANLEFLASLAFGSHETMYDYAKEKYADLIAYCTACYESAPIGTETEFTVDLADYMDFYSYSGYLDIADSARIINEFEDRSYGISEEALRGLHDFFRIPILGEFKVNFTINRRQKGGSFGTSFAGGPEGEPYRPVFDSVYINGICYLTFNTVAPNGEIADTSLIPGGYGLYRLNVRSGNDGTIVWDTPIAEMVFPMDPNVEFSYLEKSDDEKHIYLHTQQGNKLIRTILDAQTMEVLQSIELVDQPENFYREIKQYDDFVAVLQFGINNLESEKNTVTVFAEDEQGLYHHQFTVPMSPDTVDVNDDLMIFSSVTAKLDYDGEKLYVIQNEYRDLKYGYPRGDSCNFYVLAYGPEGIAYVGKYLVNLGTINLVEEYMSSSVQPWYDNPVTFLN